MSIVVFKDSLPEDGETYTEPLSTKLIKFVSILQPEEVPRFTEVLNKAASSTVRTLGIRFL